MTKAQDIKPLTALRFFAAAWVVLYDYWPKLAIHATPALIAKGYLGVDLFFVLSGFILCHVYLQSAGDGQMKYIPFLWARLARVYPLHLATLAGVGLMGAIAALARLPVDSSLLSWSSLPANLSLTQAWGLAPESGWNHASWSISAEWFAYIIFPVFAAVAWRLRGRPHAAVAGALALLIGLYGVFPKLAGFELTHATIAWGALRILPCFIYGCAIYLLWRAQAIRSQALAVAGALISGAALLGFGQAGAADVVIVAGFGPLILSLASLTSTGSRLGSNPVLIYLGEISFALYMTCIPWSLLFVNIATRLLHSPTKQLPGPLWLVLVFGLVPVAALAHRLVEQPARNQMKAWTLVAARPTQNGAIVIAA